MTKDMVDADILLEIKNVEKKALKLETEATSKREKTLIKANKIASDWITDAKKDAEKTTTKMFADAKKSVDEKKNSINDISQKETSAFIKKSEKNIKKASEYIVSEFLKNIK